MKQSTFENVAMVVAIIAFAVILAISAVGCFFDWLAFWEARP